MTTSTLQHNDNKAVEVENRVIKKLFRRLITFLFVLFVFSFLDRINIGFAAFHAARSTDASGADVYPRLLLPDQYPQRH